MYNCDWLHIHLKDIETVLKQLEHISRWFGNV